VHVGIALPIMISVGGIIYGGGMWFFFRGTCRDVWAMRK
jgi:hypothetical protein